VVEARRLEITVPSAPPLTRQSWSERHTNQIAGVVSCFERVIVQGILVQSRGPEPHSHNGEDDGNRDGAVAHTTILCWVQRYVRNSRSAGAGTLVGGWIVALPDRTVDFLLTAKRDVAAAKRFFQKR